jgi:hypothetical protein
MTPRNESPWCRRRWIETTPLSRPVVDPQLCRLPAIERAGEVLRYSALRAEYWLSPGGTLRVWLRLNLQAAVFIGLPLALVAPLIQALLATAATCSALLAECIRNLVLVLAWAGLGAALLILAAFVLRLIPGRGRMGRF